MAKDAIAIIVAGTGETTEQEVFDLLEDAYPEDQYAEIGLIVPVDKDLFSKSVQHAVAWFGDDKNVYPVQTKGASMPRAATKLGSGNQMVDKFLDVFKAEDYEDWDEVHVLIALPPEDDEDEYEFYAEVADAASEAGFKVRDLTAGLDDVTVIEAEDAAPEPEPEPEKEEPRTRRRRSRASEPEPNTDAPEEDEKPAPRRSSRAKKAESIEEVQEATKPVTDVHTEDEILTARVKSLESRVEEVEDILKRIGGVLAGPAPKGQYDERTEAEAKAEEPKDADAPKRGRGRPRTDFDVRQVFDEDQDDWIPRPKGRLKKGTEWRTIHAETGDVLEEGTA